jgi:histidyl-tRNA synthetase
MKIRSPQGTEDILPEEIGLWRYVEETVRNLFERYGYSEIRTPIMEFYSLFNRTIGEDTDIVQKEMYILHTKAEKDEDDLLVLRPELTAPVVRAYLEHNLDKTRKFQKLYYIGPLFRYERPQKGRFRQFHQVGVEAIGSDDYLLDVEVIDLAMTFLKEMGISNTRLNINCMGCRECRKTYSQILKRELSKTIHTLCENCQTRFQKNILRILDCKNEKCYKICSSIIGSLENTVCENCQEHFNNVKNALDNNRIVYQIDSHLVRGFDYYTRTVFEITHAELGAQNALCGGGRYDDLVNQIGGAPTGAVGFAIGLERIISVLKTTLKKNIEPAEPLVYVAVADPLRSHWASDNLRKEVFRITRNLRHNSVSAEQDYENKSLKAQFRTADKLHAKFVAIIGADEFSKGLIKLKKMATGEEKIIEINSLVETVKE